MSRLKIIINRPAPPPEIVRKFRDFDGLMHTYKKYYTTNGIRYMLYHERKKLVYIVIIIVFILLMLFADDIQL